MTTSSLTTLWAWLACPRRRTIKQKLEDADRILEGSPSPSPPPPRIRIPRTASCQSCEEIHVVTADESPEWTCHRCLGEGSGRL